MSDLHVIFGTGPLGRYTAENLLTLGKTVRLINRSGQMADAPAGAEVLAGDAYNPARNREMTQGAVAIYQCAQPHYHEWAEKFPPLQRAILDAAIANQARLVAAENLYMYGRFTGKLREDSPMAPHTKKGKVRAAMAQEILDAHAAGKVQAAIARGSDFFGPYDTALTDYAIRPAVEGKTVNLLGSMDQPHTFTYVKDFGALLATLGLRDEALGQVWFTPSSPPVTQAQFVGLMEQALGRPVKSRVAGPLMMRFLGLFNQSMAETVEMLYEWTAPFVVDTSKAERAFGLRPTPLDVALGETLAWCN